MSAPIPQVLYEDNHLLVLRKPQGMLSQGDDTGDDSIFEWARRYVAETKQKAGAVYMALLHRLDRPVGGVICLAKTSKAAQRLTKQFQGHTTQKVYHAVTGRAPDLAQGTLFHYLRKIRGKNIIRAYDEKVEGAKHAALEYKLLASAEGRHLLEVRPITGRQHQIRVQLAKMGCVIAGDVKYGKTEPLPDQSIALFAVSLTVEHPVKKTPETFRAVPPQNIPWNLFAEYY